MESSLATCTELGLMLLPASSFFLRQPFIGLSSKGLAVYRVWRTNRKKRGYDCHGCEQAWAQWGRRGGGGGSRSFFCPCPRILAWGAHIARAPQPSNLEAPTHQFVPSIPPQHALSSTMRWRLARRRHHHQKEVRWPDCPMAFSAWAVERLTPHSIDTQCPVLLILRVSGSPSASHGHLHA